MTTVQSIMEAKLQTAEAKAKAVSEVMTGRAPLSRRWLDNTEELAQLEVLKKARADIVEMLEGFRLWASYHNKLHSPWQIEAFIGPHCKLYVGFMDDNPGFPGVQEAKFYLHPDVRGDVHGYYWAREWEARFWFELAKFDTETIAEGLAQAIANREYGISG